MGRPKGKITNCEHIDKPHYCKGYCRLCYQKYWRKKWHGNSKLGKKNIPAWQIIKGFEEGKSYLQIAKELGCGLTNLIARLKYLGIHQERIFTNKKEYKKMSRIPNVPNRIVTVSKGYFEALGIDHTKDLFYRLHANPKTGRIEIEILYEVPNEPNKSL
jgi:DNA-binding GntR family transcriptional regulator